MKITIKAKMLLLVCFIMFCTVCLGAYGIVAFDKSNRETTSALEMVKESDELIDTARSAQVHFKKQVQEWKDTLLRGQTPEDFQKYQGNFSKEESAVQGELKKLKALMDKQGIDSTKVDELLKAHADLGNKYRQALDSYDNNKADSYLVVDKLVKGMDRTPTDGMDGVVKQIQETVAARTLAQEKSQAEQYHSVRNQMIFSIIGISVISLVLSLILIGQILRPINILKNKLADIAKNGGDLTQKIDILTKDETGELADSVNTFIYNLRSIMLEINNGSFAVSETAKQLNSSSQQTTATATATASTMSQVSASVDQITTNIKDISNKSQDTTGLASVGSEGIGQLTDQMQLISGTSKEIAGVITELNSKSQEISHIVEIINNIAGQTNLLALNAAIEAARAGEQGRGFAVVAEEVRKLAEQSADSAQEIKGLISDIQQESEKAVVAMSQGVKQIDSGNLVAQDVGLKFKEIIDAVEGLSAQIEEVAFTTEQIMAGIQNVAATTEEQTAAMQEVSASAESLAKISEDLNVIVDKFKI